MDVKTITNSMLLLGAAIGLLAAPAAYAGSHAYTNLTRSSTKSHIFVQQSLEGEFGEYATSGSAISEATGQRANYADSQSWRGYGIGTAFGLELMKFIQFEAGHTFLNLRHKDDALESLNGSRLNAGMRLVFTAPLANLELGGGVQGSRLDYQRKLENAMFYGSGLYQTVGLNYFMSSKVSFYFQTKMIQERLVRSGGNADVKDMTMNSTAMGLGFRIWL